jgi:hypothetical protein
VLTLHGYAKHPAHKTEGHKMSRLTLTKTPAAPAVTPEDSTVAACWGLTPAEWLALDDAARRARRDRVVFAPYFRTRA